MLAAVQPAPAAPAPPQRKRKGALAGLARSLRHKCSCVEDGPGAARKRGAPAPPDTPEDVDMADETCGADLELRGLLTSDDEAAGASASAAAAAAAPAGGPPTISALQRRSRRRDRRERRRQRALLCTADSDADSEGSEGSGLSDYSSCDDDDADAPMALALSPFARARSDSAPQLGGFAPMAAAPQASSWTSSSGDGDDDGAAPKALPRRVAELRVEGRLVAAARIMAPARMFGHAPRARRRSTSPQSPLARAASPPLPMSLC